MALASRTALFALAMTAALSSQARAERVEVRDAQIGGVTVPLLVLEGPEISQEAIGSAFAGADDTDAFLGLRAERVEASELSGPVGSAAGLAPWNVGKLAITDSIRIGPIACSGVHQLSSA